MDISTKYMGLELSSPVIVASSGLTENADQVKKIEDHGAGAVVLKSLFEEQIMMDVDAQYVNNMYGNFQDSEAYALYYTKKHNIENYLETIRKSKESTSFPVSASINCVSAGDWTQYAKMVEEAGADALELNMFLMPSDPSYENFDIEKIYFDVAENVTKNLSIPVSMKISSYFTAFARFISHLSKTNIKGLVLFNRFYSPDVDIEKEKIESTNVFSNYYDIAHPIRWIGILKNQVECDLVATSGIHVGEDVIKVMLVGAQAAQMATTIYKHGLDYIPRINETIQNWMEKKGYESTSEFIGKLSQGNVKTPMLYERSQFMKYFSEFHQ
jgi:dihydroorotate dehydrogenase (fumarate)